MAVEYHQKKDVNQSLIILFGFLILIGAIITYLFILRGFFGSLSFNELIPDAKAIKNAFFSSKPKAAILYSKYTENMLPSGSTWLNDNISTWQKFLGTAKLDYEVISDATIELGEHYDYQLIVLPGSKSLSDKEIIEIKKYINNGGSVFATSGTASYSNDGKWRGWEFFSEVFGSKFSKEIRSNEISAIHTLRGSLPLTANIPTGYPLKVAVWDKPMAVEVLDPRTTQVSFWYNYRLEDGLVREGIKKSAGIIYGTYGKGRFVWMGFDLNSVIGVQEDYVNFEKLFNNSINWLTYGPIAYTRDWPAGYEAAAVIAPILSEEIHNISNLLGILKAENIKATFFVQPDKAKTNENLVKEISTFGEVAAIIDIGYLSSINDTMNKLNDYETQLNKLKNAKNILESITGKEVKGLLPYYGLFNNNTIKSMIEANYKYIITDSLTDRSVPKTIIRGENRIIAMTKTARDDYEVIRDFGLTQNEFQYYTYQEDIDRILFEGGLYLLKLHTEYQCKPDNIGVVKKLIKDLKEKNFWITTGDEIQQWFAKKDYVEIRVDRRGKRRVALTVSNPGEAAINQLSIEVDLNESADQVNLETEIIGTKKARFKHTKGSKIVQLFINDLKPNESRTYYIDYDKPNA